MGIIMGKDGISTILWGTLVSDPKNEEKMSQKGNAYLSGKFSIAFKPSSGKKDDYSNIMSCKSFGKMASYIEQYYAKGAVVLCAGDMQSYTKNNGDAGYTLDIKYIVDMPSYAQQMAEQSTMTPTTTMPGYTDEFSDLQDEEIVLPF